MTRSLYFGLWAAWLIDVALAVAFGMVGIWAESDKAGATAGVFALIGGFSLCGLMPMAIVDGTPPRGLPRKEKKALRDAQARIALDAAIAKAEREAGIR